MSDIIIAMSAGHSMRTAGKRTPVFPDGSGFMHEHEFNRAVVDYLEAELTRCGFRTVRVFSDDPNIDTPLASRADAAKEAKADLYLAIHANAYRSVWGDWGGTETFAFPTSVVTKEVDKWRNESWRIGGILHRWLMKATKLRDRGLKDGQHLYEVYKPQQFKIPAVLIEAAFMDNLEEAKLLRSDTFRRDCAAHLAQGVCEAFNRKYVPAPKGGYKMQAEDANKLINILKSMYAIVPDKEIGRLADELRKASNQATQNSK